MSALSIHSVYTRPSTAHVVAAVWTSPFVVAVVFIALGAMGAIGIAEARDRRNHR